MSDIAVEHFMEQLSEIAQSSMVLMLSSHSATKRSQKFYREKMTMGRIRTLKVKTLHLEA
jgi:hypothetical protein